MEEVRSKWDLADGAGLIVNLLIGAGLLEIPYAVRIGGLVATAMVLLSVTCVMAFTAMLIGDALSSAEKGTDFVGLARAAHGDIAGNVVAFVVAAELWLGSTAFVLLAAVNIQLTCDIPVPVGIVISSFLAWFSFAELGTRSAALITLCGSTAVGGSVIALFYSGVLCHRGSHNDPTKVSLEIFESAGICLFCYGGHPAIPGIYWMMRKPRRDYKSVVVIAFTIAFSIYLTVGIGGYVLFGNDLHKSYVQNIGDDGRCEIEGGELLKRFTTGTIAVKIQSSLPLTTLPIARMAKSVVGEHGIKAKVTLCLASILVAYEFSNNLDKLCAMTGGILTILTSVVFPGLIVRSCTGNILIFLGILYLIIMSCTLIASWGDLGSLL